MHLEDVSLFGKECCLLQKSRSCRSDSLTDIICTAMADLIVLYHGILFFLSLSDASNLCLPLGRGLQWRTLFEILHGRSEF